MLRVLTLATLFPDAARPNLGIFVERQTLGLAARPGVEVEVVAPLGLPAWPLSRHPHYAPLARLPHEQEWKGLKVHRPRFRVWPPIGSRRTADAMAGTLLPFLSRLRSRFPFDVIDAEFFWPDGPAAMRLSAALGLPFSIKARGSDIHYWADRPKIGEQIRQAAAAADGLLAVSGSLRRDMERRALPADRIRVHHTGIDLDRFRPADRAAAKARLGIEGPLLLCVGALIPSKGQAVAIEALPLLPGATLLLAGDGPERKRLETLARRTGVADRVRLMGARPHGELPALYAAADATLLPSKREGLANAWLESLACGTPVVTCNAGAAREVIDRPAAGRIAARNPRALAAALGEVLAAPPLAHDVRAAASRFSWERNAAELHEHLAEIVERRAGAPRAA